MSRKRSRRYGLTGLPKIRTLGDLGAHTKLPILRLWRLIYKDEEAYTSFYIPKKSGSRRRISSPSPFLRSTQKWILNNILNRLRPEHCCYGFEPGSKLRTHAEKHLNSKAVLTLDLEDFFPSISIARIVQIYKAAGYSSKGSWILARLCTIEGTLPQGAPTSPRLANLACYRLDRRLSEFADSMGFVYTRYADDLSFSASAMSELAKARHFISHIVMDSGFRLNNNKTRIAGPRRAKVITGLVIGPKQVGIGRRRLRHLRAMIHRSHVTGDEKTVASIQGWLDFVSDVDPARYKMLAAYIQHFRMAHTTTVLHRLRVRDVAGSTAPP